MSIQKSYNKWADQYDTNYNRTRDLDQRATRETLTKYSFSKVIELGSGTGKNSDFLLEKAEKLVCMDFSYEMLKMAQAKISDTRVTFIYADITKDWNVKDSFADLITCNLVLEHIENLDFIFKEANKNLKPEGLFFISELHPFKQYKGSKARFETDNGVHELETYTHHISEFFKLGKKYGFELLELEEWFDDEQKVNLPRLIVIVFKKVNNQ